MSEKTSEYYYVSLAASEIRNCQSLSDMGRSYPDRVEKIVLKIINDNAALNQYNQKLENRVERLSEEIERLVDLLKKYPPHVVVEKVAVRKKSQKPRKPNRKSNLLKSKGVLRTFNEFGRKCLSAQELEVVTRHYGLDGWDQLTLSELSSSLEVSTTRIRQIKNKAIKKLIDYKELVKIATNGLRMMMYIYAEDQKLDDFIKQGVDACQTLHNEFDNAFAPEDIYVGDIGLSTSAYNILTRNGIRTVRDINDYEHSKGLMSLLNLGEATYRHIISRLKIADKNIKKY